MVCKVAKYVAFGSGNFPVGVGLDVFCPSAYEAACRLDWKRDKARGTGSNRALEPSTHHGGLASAGPLRRARRCGQCERETAVTT